MAGIFFFTMPYSFDFDIFRISATSGIMHNPGHADQYFRLMAIVCAGIRTPSTGAAPNASSYHCQSGAP